MSNSSPQDQMPACYAEIDTQALRNNYRILKEQANGVQLMAVIKANAYGHDAEVVAKALPDADAFGVARLNEALKLRAVNVSNRIVVLGGVLTIQDWIVADENELDVVLHQATQLDTLSEFLEQTSSTSKIAIWLKFDTGMHRLGFALEKLKATVDTLSVLQSKLREASVVMSHFANADDPKDPYTTAQLVAFKSLQPHFSKLDGPEYSLANSSALLYRDDVKFDWVRSGLALYGVSEHESGRKFGLEPVMSLRSRLIEIKTVRKGECVGYGQIWQAQEDTLIGIASIGYGDGYPRESVEVIAKSAGTIPYTLLCGISQRVETIVK